MAIDVKKLLFRVREDASVSLLLGPVEVEVCKSPRLFSAWAKSASSMLNLIAKEIRETYVDEEASEHGEEA